MHGKSATRKQIWIASPIRVCESKGGNHVGDKVKAPAEKLAASDAAPEIQLRG